ncbi:MULTISPECIES: ABC transporter ATP-binding protein [Rothia]|jgi:ABC transporter, ATP-binding protein|uniref:ABC transporter ATP-binding protein n=1 Tax=Rothia TaxID=32207 RepID=UPI0008A86C4E|nr:MULTISPECIES: ABC transporter ATP-binding protein [Rothia]MBF1665641.1 ABC transporter ATP-binding protein [Rothia sp. (in: high G+C Gram-positive bacteria)]MBF1668179.1 ABC transporter ATP-binding protein [Rothia sp. (in: high G+C Gram-positive bacteria)]OHQ12749.1 ABC transporter [Rothia sp. HMSC064F07]
MAHHRPAEPREQMSPQERAETRERSMALLRQMLRPHRGALALSIISVLLVSGSSAVAPILIARVLDSSIEPLKQGDVSPLLTLLTFFVVATAVTAIFSWVNVAYTVRVSLGVVVYLRKRVFRHAQLLSVSFHERYTSGKVISRLTSDIDTVRSFLDSGISQLAITLLSMVISAVAIFLLDWRIGLFMLVMGVPIYFLTRWFQKTAVPVFRMMRTESAHLTSRFVETFTGIRAVKAFGAEAQMRSEYAQASERYRLAVMDSIKIFGVYSPMLMLLGNVFIAGALVLGGYAVLGGTMQIGTLLALVIYANRVFEPVMQLSEFYNMFQSAMSALEKLSSFLAEEPEVAEPDHPYERTVEPAAGTAEGASGKVQGALVELDSAVFGYTSDRHALKETTLRIEPGTTVALVGATGAGKSTIAKLVARFYDVSAGQVRIDGVDVRQLADVQLRREVLMLTQEVFLFSASILENIRMGNPQASDEQVKTAAKAVGADAFIERLCEGYESQLGRGGITLSAGQRQLVSFARVFLANPRVLILDEATASLDIPSERAVQAALRTVLAGRTALVIAHRLSTVLGADRVLVIHEGSVVEDGSPQQLIASGGRFAAMYASWDELNQVQETEA